MRNIRIILDRFGELPLKEFLGLLKATLFCDEPVLIYKYDLQGKSIGRVLSDDGLEFRKGQAKDLERVARAIKPLPWEFQCHNFDGVEDFFIAEDDSGIHHISWVYFRKHRNRFLALGEREAEIKFCLTLPALRGRGIYPRVLLSILEYLHSMGIERVFMCVHRDNHSSIRGIEKAGFVRVGENRLKKVAGFQVSPRFNTHRRLQ